MRFELIEGEWNIYVSITYEIIDTNNGLSPIRHHAIIKTNADILLIIGYVRTDFTIKMQVTLSLKNMSFAKYRPFYFGLDMLTWGLAHSGGILE